MGSPVGDASRRVVVGLCLCGLFLAAQRAVFADGVVRDGLGAISSGRGGTNIAHSDNGVILLDNPAALVNVKGNGLAELSVDTLWTDLHYSDPQNDDHGIVNPFALGQMAFIRKSANGRWAFGLGAFAPAGFGAEFDLNGPAPIGGRHTYKSLGALGKILPGFAYRVNDRLSVGGTFGLAVSHAELEGPFFLQAGILRGTPTVLDLQGTGVAPTWSAGLQYQITECTTFGVAFQSENRFQLDGNAAVTVLGVGHSQYDADIDLVWPRSVGIGLKHDFCRHRIFSLDVIWFDWSHAFDRVDLKLTNATNPVFTSLLGPAVQNEFPLNWRDSVSVRAGYEHAISPCAVLRAGYAYHSNQIPEGYLTPFIPAILEHAFSVGYGRTICRWNIDLAYQFSFGRDRTVTTSDLAGGDFDSSHIHAGAHWFFLSLVHRF